MDTFHVMSCHLSHKPRTIDKKRGRKNIEKKENASSSMLIKTHHGELKENGEKKNTRRQVNPQERQ